MENPTFTIDIETKTIEFNLNGGVRGLQGDKGDTGAAGYTPQKGVDYFTQEDIASLNIPSKTSDLTNDSGFVNTTQLNTKQDKIDSSHKLSADLVAETNTKKFLDSSVEYQTINGKKTFANKSEFQNGLESWGVFNINDSSDGGVLIFDGGSNDEINWYRKNNFNDGATTIAPTNDSDVANKKYVDDNIPDLTDYVQNTDYATNSTGGVIRTGTGYATAVASNGQMYATTKTYSDYDTSTNGMFISKGTLENVLNNRIGDINTALDSINGEVI